MADAGTAYIEFRGDYSEVDRGARTAGVSAGSTFGRGFRGAMSSGLSGAASAIAGFAKTGAAVLGGLTVAGAGWGLSVAAQAEQAEIAFTTMLGSGEKARAFLDDLKSFAASTPFEFPELQTAASSLISAGFAAEDVIPIMTTLGDVTSGMGTGAEGVQRATVALQQMAAAGRITGEDLNQLRDAGIPVFDLLASATGKSKEEVAALAQAGKLGKDEMEALFEALRTGGGGLERFSGLMEAQSQSLAGLLSTLKDTLGQGLADALGPVIPLLKDMIPNITATASALTTLFGGVIAQLAPRVLPLLESLAEILTNTLGSAFDALSPVLEPLVDLLDEIGSVIGDVLLDAFEALAPIFPVMADAIRDLSPLIRTLVTRLGEELTDALAELVPVMAENAPQFIELAEAMLELAIAVLPLIGPLASLIGAFSRLQAFLAGNVIAPAIRAIAAALGAVTSFDFAGAWGAVQRFFSGIPEVVGRALSALPGLLRNVGNNAIRFLLDAIRGAVPAVLSFLAGTPGRMVAAMGALAGLLIRFAADSFARFLSAVRTGAVTIVSYLKDAPGRFLSALSSLTSLLSRFGSAAMGFFATAIRSGVSTIIDIAKALPGKFLDGLGDLSEYLLDAGAQLIEGLIDGIESAAGSVADAVADVVPDFIPGFGKSGSGKSALPGLDKSAAIIAGAVSGWSGGDSGGADALIGPPPLPAGDLILEVDGERFGRIPSVYRGIAARHHVEVGARR